MDMTYQHITKNCLIQSSLRCVENHAEEIENYDGYDISKIDVD